MVILYILDSIRESDKFKKLILESDFLKALGNFVENALNPRLLKLFLTIADFLEDQNDRKLTLSRLASVLATEYSIPLSTAKWNIKRLLELGLISGGFGKPTKLTNLGRIIVFSLRGDDG